MRNICVCACVCACAYIRTNEFYCIDSHANAGREFDDSYYTAQVCGCVCAYVCTCALIHTHMFVLFIHTYEYTHVRIHTRTNAGRRPEDSHYTAQGTVRLV